MREILSTFKPVLLERSSTHLNQFHETYPQRDWNSSVRQIPNTFETALWDRKRLNCSCEIEPRYDWIKHVKKYILKKHVRGIWISSTKIIINTTAQFVWEIWSTCLNRIYEAGPQHVWTSPVQARTHSKYSCEAAAQRVWTGSMRQTLNMFEPALWDRFKHVRTASVRQTCGTRQ